MKYFQSQIERLLYILLVILVICNVGALLLLSTDTSRLNAIVNNHTHTIAIESQNTKQVEANQRTNALAIKTYIACLLNINPAQTAAQIQVAKEICFNAAPEVK